MFVAAGYDYYRNRGGATRWREYRLVVVGGLVGAVFGMVNDVVTSSIPPEYFTLGKGLAGGDGLQTRAALLGMQAGSSAGNSIAVNHKRLASRHVSSLCLRIRSKRGHAKAVGAVVRHSAEASFWMLSRNEDYKEPKLKSVSPTVV